MEVIFFMTMGLILLGIMMLALFFEVGRSAFRGLGLSTIGAFMVILAFAIGIIVPSISFGGVFYMNVGGFILPILAMFVLLVVLIRNNAVLRGVAAMLSVVAATVGLLLIMPVNNTGMIVLTSFVLGLISGALAFIIGRTRVASLFAVTGGIAVGDVIFCMLDYFVITGGAFTLGRVVVYNSIFVAALFALCLAEIVVMTGKAMGEERTNKRNLNFEATEDRAFKSKLSDDDDYDRFDDELF